MEFEEIIINGLSGTENISSVSINGKDEIVFYDNDKQKLVVINNKGEIIREIEEKSEGNIVLSFDKSGNIYELSEYSGKNGKNEIIAKVRQLKIYDGQGKRLNDDKAVNKINKTGTALKKGVNKKNKDRQ